MKRRNIIAFIMFICAFVLVGVGVLSSCSKVSGNSTYNSTPTNSSSSNQNSSNKESNSSTPSSNSSNEPIKKVTITFDANGGLFKDNTSSKKINIDSGIYDLNSVEIPTYTNHYFEGWYDNEDSSKGKLYKGSINVINDITLYASYKDGYSDTYLNAEGFSEWDKNDFSSLNYLNYKLKIKIFQILIILI